MLRRPFSIGSEVTWELTALTPESSSFLSTLLGADVAARITHCETHHTLEAEDEGTHTRGSVRSIRAVYWSSASGPNSDDSYPIAGSAVLVDRQTADGEGVRADLDFEGYVVELIPLD